MAHDLRGLLRSLQRVPDHAVGRRAHGATWCGKPVLAAGHRGAAQVRRCRWDSVGSYQSDAGFGPAAILGKALLFNAPEQSGRMGRSVDYRADLYALGACMYWALSGRAPFAESQPLARLQALLTRAPERLDAIHLGVPAAVSAVVM